MLGNMRAARELNFPRRFFSLWYGRAIGERGVRIADCSTEWNEGSEGASACEFFSLWYGADIAEGGLFAVGAVSADFGSASFWSGEEAFIISQ